MNDKCRRCKIRKKLVEMAIHLKNIKRRDVELIKLSASALMCPLKEAGITFNGTGDSSHEKENPPEDSDL